MNHNIPQNNNETDQQRINGLIVAGRGRKADSPRRLDQDSTRDTLSTTVMTPPLVAVEKYSGNYEEGITHLMTIGNRVLAISRGINKKLIGSGKLPVDSVRISVLPIGDHEAASKHSSVTIAEVSLAELAKPRQDGKVQKWQDIMIGRDLLNEKTGTADTTVSSMHAKITIMEDGGIVIKDSSTNGTQVFDEKDLMSSRDYGGLDDAGKHNMAALLEQLEKNPHEWNKDNAGKTVVANAQ